MGAAEALSGGFSAPGPEAARAFRTLLDAMARPGSRQRVAGARPPLPLSPAAGTALLALADAETPLWLPDRLSGAAADWLAFHTNAPRTAPERAVFALGRWEELAPIARFAAGTPDYPDRSATLLVEVAALEGGPELRLSGPGLPAPAVFAPRLPEDAAAALAANAARFPLGVDLVFAAGGEIAALPRSTRLEV